MAKTNSYEKKSLTVVNSPIYFHKINQIEAPNQN